MQIAAAIVGLFSILIPTKQWFAPDQPILIDVQADQPLQLVLTDFTGRAREASSEEAMLVQGKAQVDLRKIYPQLDTPGTFLLYAVPPGEATRAFVGTPLVVQVRRDRRDNAPEGPMVVHVAPLEYAVITTDHGTIEVAFYHDVAPHTASNFITLARQGYFDGLEFHRVVPGFVIQGGDPRGDGTGGPGYTIPAEFNERPHVEGVLSMARQGDPNERSGAMPRREFADSAGSQFFICLDYSRTRALDRKYTAFGRVTAGMEAVRAIAGVELADAARGRPAQRQTIQKVELKPVTPDHNPYRELITPIIDQPTEK
jgi:peptidyl-prolyl cis-trans isomerase B (cyclophilin B)